MQDVARLLHGFTPDPDAWERYSALIGAARAALTGAADVLPPETDPQPLAEPPEPATADLPPGYDRTGWGDLADMVADLRDGVLTPRAAVSAALDTSAARDATYNGIVALEPDRALATADRLGALPPTARGPLAGAPYARKDLFYRAGFPALCGSPLRPGHVPQVTATAVDRLDAAGGIDIGRLAMAELAMSPTGFNTHESHPANPWNPAHVPGGSSSGSAVAVTAGYVPLALGTDTGGSIRHPAAMCGLTGLKPTYGRVSRAGAWPLSWNLDHVGPLARSARDCAIALHLLSGHDPQDSTAARPGWQRPALTGDLTGLRIARPGGYYDAALTPAVRAALDATAAELAAAGATLVDTECPDMATINALAHVTLAVEAATQLRRAFLGAGEKVGRQVRDRLEPGLFYAATDYADALRLRAPQRAAWLAAAMADADAVLIPAISREVPTIAETTQAPPAEIAAVIGAVTHTTRGINYLGLPALVAPCGQDAAGLPIAFQLVGRPWDEATILRIADAYQRRTGWHTRRPPSCP